MKWDRWIGNTANEPVYFQKKLFKLFGWTLRLHKFIKADDVGCFHSHPAHAFRLILWGGYIEEVYGTTDGYDVWTPGRWGRVAPKFVHRVDRLINMSESYSLWFVGPKVADIELHGPGWPDDLEPFHGARRVRIK